MNNLEILKEAKKIYNPSTAFGNSELIELLKQIQAPNKAGFFEIEGKAVSEVVGVKWECADCGHRNENEFTKRYFNFRLPIEEKCPKCNAKHQIIIQDIEI